MATHRIYPVVDHPSGDRSVEACYERLCTCKLLAERLSPLRPAVLKAPCSKFRQPLLILYETTVLPHVGHDKSTCLSAYVGSNSPNVGSYTISLSSRAGAELRGWSQVSGRIPKCRDTDGESGLNGICMEARLDSFWICYYCQLIYFLDMTSGGGRAQKSH